MNSAGNCFDPIRHFAAFLVLFSHHFALSGRQEPSVPGWDTFGFVAVAIFFAISGFFMPQSYARAGSFLAFMAKRCRRIFPGMIVCSFIMIYVIGAAFTASKLIPYLLSREQFDTFLLFSTLGGRPIPTVFSDFIYKFAINGSLWTLILEFEWYIVIGLALWFRNSWKTAAFLLGISSASVLGLGYWRFDFPIVSAPASYLSLFGVSFTTGALMSMTKEAWLPYRAYMVAIAIMILLLLRGQPGFQVVGTASLAALTVVIGVSFADKFIRGRFDISYGVYIYAFPIQQIVINRVTGNFWGGMLIAAVLTIIAATLSYKFVEKPFLKRRAQSPGPQPVSMPATLGTAVSVAQTVQIERASAITRV